MKVKRLSSLAAFVGLLAVTGPVWAHHGEANYDTTRIVSVKGTITDFVFVNPHVQISLEAKDDKGNVEKWMGEATSPNLLVREGWDKNTLKPGDVITVSGHQAKNGSRTLRLMKMVMPDGREFEHL
jgi:uncharacterized protein DUF6152